MRISTEGNNRKRNLLWAGILVIVAAAVLAGIWFSGILKKPEPPAETTTAAPVIVETEPPEPETEPPMPVDPNALREIDWKGLQERNSDVVAWIYVPGTVIDYPVMHGATNDTYLHHSYDKTYNASGSIFIDERNQRNYADPVTILYGHHMASGAMFATLEWWQLGSYREEHPVMWLLTPDQDYKVELYSAYTTSAYSDTYEIPVAGSDPSNYIWKAENSSDWHINPDLDPNDHYIVMSICAYVFEDARSVLHGKLMQVVTAGGVPIE